MAGDEVRALRPSRETAPRLQPVSPGQPGRRRVAVALVAMTAFVGAALLKPWGDGSRPQAANSVVSPAASAALGLAADVPPAQPAFASGWAGVPFVPGPRPTIDPAIIRASLRAQPRWGIRAVVDVSPDGQPRTSGHLEERWAPAGPGGGVSPATNGHPIRALGVTLGPETVALDVRVLREVRGRERWLDVEPVAGATPGAAVLFWPPRGPDGWKTSWEPGRYRFFILTAGGVVDVEAYLPGSGGSRTPVDAVAPLWTGSPVTGGWLGADTRLSEGPFAGVIPDTSETGPTGPTGRLPSVLPLAGRSAPALDLATVWLGAVGAAETSAGAGVGAGASAGAVGAYLPGAVALGVAAAPGVRVGVARLVRLLPDGPASRPVVLDAAVPIVTTIDHSRQQEVVRFEAPDGGPWPPGVYRIELELTGPAGAMTRAYAVTLLPGSARAIPGALTAARAWARFAGTWGVAAGLQEPLEGPARLAIRYARQAPEPAVAGGADLSRRCLEVNLVDAAQPILGISHPIDAAPDSVALQRVFLDGTTPWATPALARSVVPGLSLVAAGEGTAWAPGWYRLILHRGGALSALPLCVGRVTDSQLRVPPEAGLRVPA